MAIYLLTIAILGTCKSRNPQLPQTPLQTMIGTISQQRLPCLTLKLTRSNPSMLLEL